MKTVSKLSRMSLVSLGLLLGTSIALSSALAQPGSFPGGNPEQELLADPNFPMSPDEITQFLDEVRQNVAALDPAPGLKIQMSEGAEVLLTNVFDERTNTITLNRKLGTLYLGKVARSKKERAKFDMHFRSLFAHEYGHALLHPKLMAEPGVADVISKFQKLQDDKASAEGNEDLVRRWTVVLAYHEIFGDLMASVYQGNPRAIPDALKFGFADSLESVDKTVWIRGFAEEDYVKKGKTFLTKFGETLIGTKVTPYHAFFPVRHILWNLLQAVPQNERGEAVARLAEGLAQEAALQVGKPISELTIREMNESMEKRVQSILTH